MFHNRFIFIFVLVLTIGENCYSELNRTKLLESDSIYYQSIESIQFSPNEDYFVVNQKEKTNRVNILKKNGSLYKSYSINDSYTDKYFEIIQQKNVKEPSLTTNYLRSLPDCPTILYNNTFSKSSFLNDSIVYIIGSINYLVQIDSPDERFGVRLKKSNVLFRINIFTDSMEVNYLDFIPKKLYPQSDYFNIVNRNIYIKLFPMDVHKNIPTSQKFVLGIYNIESSDWSPLLELPEEYESSNVKLKLDYDYRISNFRDKTYFMAPLLHYMFSLEQDTIWLNDLVNPIKFSLEKFGSETINLPEELYKLDSLSHSIVDFFFSNNFLYIVLNKPKNNNGKIYLHKYNLEGKFIESKELNKGRELEAVCYSENNNKLYKFYMENEEWWVEEIDFN